MKNELDIVRDVSMRLEQGSLAYMLTGSMAMNYYAQPRMTRDIDVVVPRDECTSLRAVKYFPRYRQHQHGGNGELSSMGAGLRRLGRHGEISTDLSLASGSRP